MSRLRGGARRLLQFTLACGVSLFAFTTAASAATFTVTTTSDPSGGTCTPGSCSLRQAFAAVSASPGPDTIVLPAGTYTLAHGQLPTITNSSSGLTLSGAGARTTTISGNHGSRIISIDSGTVAISGVTLTDGFNNDSTGVGSTSGGAIQNSGTLSLTDVAVTDSTYEGSGGGGAIASQGDMTLDRVTIAGNKASGDGGGIWIPTGTLTTSITDSTIVGNAVDATLVSGSGGTEFGGGIESDAGNLSLTNSTIADNTLNPVEPGVGGGILLEGLIGATATAVNSIVAENTTDCGYVGGGPVSSTGPNLDSDGTCFAGPAALHANPLLQPLADSGGQTDTRALDAGSPAIDAGQNSGCPASDQRGVSRPQGAVCDLGAYETTAPIVQGATVSSVTSSAASFAGTVNPDDQAAFSYVEYGTSTAYGSATPAAFVGSAYGAEPVMSTATGLEPSTTYHFRLVAVSAIGTTRGTDGTFTTAPPATENLGVSLAGDGSGTITATGINCPGTCSNDYPYGTTVVLQASPAPGSTFAGWSGACTGTGGCQLVLSAARSVTATFTRIPRCTLRILTNKIVRKLAASVRCDEPARLTLTGELTVVGKNRSAIRLGPVHATSWPGVVTSLSLTLPKRALGQLRKHTKEFVMLTLSASNANGTATVHSPRTALKPTR